MRRLADWIEYMEGEGDRKQMSKLGLLLKHSVADQVVLDNLRRLRRLIKQADRAETIENTISNSDYLNDFHSQIMSKIARPQKRALAKPISLRSNI